MHSVVVETLTVVESANDCGSVTAGSGRGIGGSGSRKGQWQCESFQRRNRARQKRPETRHTVVSHAASLVGGAMGRAGVVEKKSQVAARVAVKAN